MRRKNIFFSEKKSLTFLFFFSSQRAVEKANNTLDYYEVSCDLEELVEALEKRCYGCVTFPRGGRFRKRGFFGARIFFVQCAKSNNPTKTIPKFCDPNMRKGEDWRFKVINLGGRGKGSYKKIPMERRVYLQAWIDGPNDPFRVFAWIPGFSTDNVKGREMDDSLNNFATKLWNAEAVISSGKPSKSMVE